MDNSCAGISASFAANQIQSVVTSQAKAIVKLEALSKKLKRGELPKATLSSVKKKVSEILSPQHLKKIISTDTTLKGNQPVLTYFLNPSLFVIHMRMTC